MDIAELAYYLEAGDTLTAEVQGETIVLTFKNHRARITVKDIEEIA